MGFFLLNNFLFLPALLWLSSLPSTHAATCSSYGPNECFAKVEENCRCELVEGGFCKKSEECANDGLGTTSTSDASAYLPVGHEFETVDDEGFTVGEYKEDCGSHPTCFAMTPSLEFCENQCSGHAACNSFSYCTGASNNPSWPRCHLKTKKVDFMMKSHYDCTTYRHDGSRVAEKDNMVARTEGMNLASYSEGCTEDTMDTCHRTTPTWDSCRDHCSGMDGCRSFAYCTGMGHPTVDFPRCYLKTSDFATKSHVGGDCRTYYPAAPAMCKDSSKWYRNQGCCGAPLKSLDMSKAKPTGMQEF